MKIMSRKIYYTFLVVVLVLSGMMAGGCGGEEKTEPAPITTPEPAPEPEPEPEPVKIPPVAQIIATPDTIKTGESITFSGVDSTDSDGNITSYEWDFGDGQTALGDTVTHTYSERCGTYKVKLTITDDDDLIDTAEVSVKVLMGILVRIEATTSTWREGEQPYDIYNAIKQELEEAGFEVVQQDSTGYDAILSVDYKEEKDGKYSSGDYGTKIEFHAELHDNLGKELFSIELHATTPVVAHSLYSSAVNDLLDEVYFKYLGEFIATKFGVGDEVSVIIRALDDEDSSVRTEAADALGEAGYTTAVEPLIRALRDENNRVRWSAADALGKLGDTRAVEPLILALHDEDSSVRQHAADALGKLGDARAVEPLIQALNDASAIVRRDTSEALGEISDTRAVEPLIQALHDEDDLVRRYAAEALGKIGDARAVEPLIQALNDEAYDVLYHAVVALGVIGDVRAIEPLTQALNDEDYLIVHNVIEKALEKIREKQTE
jgi:PKD repeat protein